tara:strand:+ start:141 stop:326 length:186 start_codon:yes stop_codon:yes gene_type:complete
VLQEQLVQPALQEQQELRGLPDHRVQQVLMVQTVQMEQRVQLDLKGRKALLVLKVHRETQV